MMITTKNDRYVDGGKSVLEKTEKLLAALTKAKHPEPGVALENVCGQLDYFDSHMKNLHAVRICQRGKILTHLHTGTVLRDMEEWDRVLIWNEKTSEWGLFKLGLVRDGQNSDAEK